MGKEEGLRKFWGSIKVKECERGPQNWLFLPFLCWNRQILSNSNTFVIIGANGGGGQENIFGSKCPFAPVPTGQDAWQNRSKWHALKYSCSYYLSEWAWALLFIDRFPYCQFKCAFPLNNNNKLIKMLFDLNLLWKIIFSRKEKRINVERVIFNNVTKYSHRKWIINPQRKRRFLQWQF